MKLIHYCQNGYEGKYIDKSVCGKEVNTHLPNEGCSIHPEKANCKACLKTEVYKNDLYALKNIFPDIKRRIYIESDILHADEFRSAKRTVKDFAEDKGLKCVNRVFSQVHDFAWHNLKEVWESVKIADEIYATSSLMPLSGNSYNGAPVIFNGMCERAVKEGISGKDVIILNTLKHINWYMIEMDIMKAAFKKNTLYMYDEKYDKLIKIDVTKIKGK